MNRPIKFRAWDDRNKRFGYMTIQANMIAWPSNLWMSQVSHDDEGVRFDDVTDWQQFTGLLDKSGREIYEGDIVKWSDITGEVKFGGNNDGWFILMSGIEYHLSQEEYREVIGNIHEHPELLSPEKGVGK